MISVLLLSAAIAAEAESHSERSLTSTPRRLGQTGAAEGVEAPPGDRWGLVNDGSFEFGECGAGSAWNCTTNTTCTWILDPLPVWGYPAYDGELAAWLGGFCGTPNSNSFCQALYLDGNVLRWRYMGYVEEGHSGNFVYLKLNGDIVWAKEMTWPEDHTYGRWVLAEAELGWVAGDTYYVCFEFEASTGANMLIDYVECVPY